jgi:hypothetical protein
MNRKTRPSAQPSKSAAKRSEYHRAKRREAHPQDKLVRFTTVHLRSASPQLKQIIGDDLDRKIKTPKFARSLPASQPIFVHIRCPIVAYRPSEKSRWLPPEINAHHKPSINFVKKHTMKNPNQQSF